MCASPPQRFDKCISCFLFHMFKHCTAAAATASAQLRLRCLPTRHSFWTLSSAVWRLLDESFCCLCVAVEAEAAPE